MVSTLSWLRPRIDSRLYAYNLKGKGLIGYYRERHEFPPLKLFAYVEVSLNWDVNLKVFLTETERVRGFKC